MAVFSGHNTRVVALLSFISALLYYQTGSKAPPGLPIEVQVNDGGSLVHLNLSFSDLQHYVKMKEVETRHKSGEASSTQQPQHLPAFVLDNKKVLSKTVKAGKMDPWQVPGLEPSGGAFLRQLNFSGFNKEDREFLEDRRKVLMSRGETMSEVCRSRRRPTESSIRLVWDTNHIPNVIWCPLYKVASTSWMINFLRLAHFNDDNPEILNMPPKKREKNKFSVKFGARQDKVYDLYPPPEDPRERIHVFKNGLRVLIVRHPYSRIISAYRDKMLKMNPRPVEHKFRELQLKIIDKYRKKNSNEKSPFPTFPEFIQYIIDHTKDLHTREEWINNVVCWTPYWAQCDVCSVDYNLILKLETMQKDEKFLITLTNMTELKQLKTREWRHLQDGTPSDTLVTKYFKQLTVSQIKQLRDLYRLDFKLFDYHQVTDLLKNTQD
ncbi:carbohydrate sulfotransferase 11-like [Homarus americanus]|uniref:carbohydrate sulfotransferase 11-like n=1 Tax=Homarus americanus TaxID=6706 RepID=UPI001C44CCEF|nr:carbohydrate sulfotransferase 11-like [Homarus americanus]